MDDQLLLEAADRRAAACTCGAGRCARCRGTGWEPGSPPPRAECTACDGLGGDRPHTAVCPGEDVTVLGYSQPLPPGR